MEKFARRFWSDSEKVLETTRRSREVLEDFFGEDFVDKVFLEVGDYVL